MNAVRPLDVSDAATAQAVVVLQREAYAVEAALIGSNGIPALTQSLEAVQAAGEDWLGMSDGEGLLGAVSWRELDVGTVDIHRLIVAPRAFRLGVATALLDALDAAFRIGPWWSRRAATTPRRDGSTNGVASGSSATGRSCPACGSRSWPGRTWDQSRLTAAMPRATIRRAGGYPSSVRRCSPSIARPSRLGSTT